MATHAFSTAERRPEGASSAPGRRSLFTAAPLLAMALAAPARADDPSPDGELLATCAAFDELERAYIATDHNLAFDTPAYDAAEAERDRLREAQVPLVARMTELCATTLEGMAARARCLVLWDDELMKEDGPLSCYTNVKLTRAVVRDLLAGSAGA